MCRYHLLGIATDVTPDKDVKRKQRRAQRKFERMRLGNELRANMIRNLPKNVTY
jgi:preprotein translocase subunit Sec63